MRGMILAAGFGTRFQPVTHTVPKPMIPVLNRPLLGWAVEACIAEGFDEIIVNLHHIPDPIRDYLRSEFGSRASFELSDEEKILGTGGALRRVRHLLDDEFVLMNGDTIQWPPFSGLLETRRGEDALACLLLRPLPHGATFTRVWLEEKRITGFGEGTGEAMMFAGAHAMSPAIVDLLPDRDFSGLTEDVYVPATKKGRPPLAGYVHEGLWFDVGDPARYMEATRGLLRGVLEGVVTVPAGSERLDSSVRASFSTIEGTLAWSCVGKGSRVGKGACLEGSVLWDDVTVGAGSTIVDSIIAHDIDLPDGSFVENLLVSPRVATAHHADEAHLLGDWIARPIDSTRDWQFKAG